MTSVPPPPSDFLPAPSATGVRRFAALYRARFGRELSETEAADLARRYLLLYHISVSPPPPLPLHRGERIASPALETPA